MSGPTGLVGNAAPLASKPERKTQGYAIDTGFRITQQTTGRQFALIVCAGEGDNGWLVEIKKGKTPWSTRCQGASEHE
ncbi:MAG TPA: hypothetical protein VGL03_06915, partial [Thermoanaerobaculia bacterium]